MFQAHTALTELSFAGAPGVRRSTVMEDAKVVAKQLNTRPGDQENSFSKNQGP
jgi:hypothetical protein